MDIKANKVDSMPRSLSTNDLIADEWNQLVYENNAILAKGNITPSSSNTTQLLSAIQNISEDKTNDTMMDCYSDIDEIWHKPSDWIDIRSAALPNSVYFLVGHSADYSKYRYFAVQATISNSGTYDVVIDGIKYATTNSEVATQIDWQTLALESGWNTTYPEALHTHIVRVTPTSSSNTFSEIRCADPTGMGTSSLNEPQLGVLWCHYTIDYVINAHLSFAYYPWHYWNPDLIAVTTSSGVLKVSSLQNFMAKGSDLTSRGPSKIECLPIFDLNNQQVPAMGAFMCQRYTTHNTKLKKICLQNGTLICSGRTFSFLDNLEKIECKNATISISGDTFYNLPKLKSISQIDFPDTHPNDFFNLFVRCNSLENIVLDVSYNNVLTRATIGATASSPVYGLKGLIVSNNAPFDNATSPQLDVSYTGLDRAALVTLFNTMPTVSNNQVCNVTGAIGAKDLTAEDIAIATNKGWTVTK